MRLFVDEEGLPWTRAWELTTATFGYTNHTLLPEALERWPVPLFERLLPRHLQIIYDINERFLKQVEARWPGDDARRARMSLIEEAEPKQVRMAHLATVGSHSVNGVAQLHTQLVKRDLLPDFHTLWPERFNNKTNGVSPRRWLLYANARLTRLISSRLGPTWIERDLALLRDIEHFAWDESFLRALRDVKQSNKRDLTGLLRRTTGVELPADALFLVQVKRIHEYKRQLLTGLQVMAHYVRLKREPGLDFVPRTYVFAGKAAPSYGMAKLHIKLLNDVAAVVNADKAMRGRLAVAFVPNYGVTLAQAIVPAADLSLQISTAGKEASGTSNMKLALNGALTLGTYDGANVELHEAVGAENFFLFGLRADEVTHLNRRGYDPRLYIDRSPALNEVLALLKSGFWSRGDLDIFRPIVDGLRHEDPFLVCADFEAYSVAENEAADVYRDSMDWARRALLNIAGASRFSADDTIRQYASEIWGIRPVAVDLGQTPLEP
jgi:starch phosphorylase